MRPWDRLFFFFFFLNWKENTHADLKSSYELSVTGRLQGIPSLQKVPSENNK